MDNEQREGRAASKGVEQTRTDLQRHPLPARPLSSLKTLAPAPTSLFYKENASGSRDFTSQQVQAFGPPIEILSLPSKPSNQTFLAAMKDRNGDNLAPDSSELEPQPVPFFLEEKEPINRTQEQSFATGGNDIPLLKSKESAGRGNSKLLIDGITTDTQNLSIVPPRQSPRETSTGWKRISAAGEGKDHVQDVEKPPIKFSVNLHGHTKPIPTGPRHREGSQTSGGANGIWNASYKTPGQLPSAPRAMRMQETATFPATQQKAQNTSVSPTISPTSEQMPPLKAEDPPQLEGEDPIKSKNKELPKVPSDFQPLPGFKYTSSGFPSVVNVLAMNGSLVSGFPTCPQQCNVASATSGESGKSPARGKLGCPHSVTVDLKCLSSTLPKEMTGSHFELLNLKVDAPHPMTRVPSGSCLYVQATGEHSGGHLCWHIILETNAEQVSKFFAKRGKSLESGTLVPDPNELLEAAKSSIPIHRCEQQLGDLICLPPQSWYQVTAVQTPVDLRVWHAYPLTAITAKGMTRDMFSSHRTCDPIIPVRTMLYHHLRALHDSIVANTPPTFSHKRDSKAFLQNLADAIRLFDRILAEEYTQGSREDEPILEEPGSCDFCGTDIFHAAFVCSSKLGVWARSSLPSKCCEVQLCPSCCSEGRSCVCGNLRLCSVYDYDGLVDMRNKIWAWYLSMKDTAYAPDGINQVLTTADVYEDLRYPHLALGAISILNIRNSLWADEKYTGDGLRLIASCKGGALNCENHEVSQLQAITCNECHETICFKHLLAAGIHSWEAAFRWEHDRSWHEVHTNWSAQWVKWSKVNPPDHEDLLITLATSLPVCKPLKHASVRLGFYDLADSSVNCARYEDDPILRWLEDKFFVDDSAIPNIESIAPAIKALKTFKRKSVTPGPGELSDSRTAKRKKKGTERDAAFNPRPGGRKTTAAKGSKAKSRLSITTPVTPINDGNDSDGSVDTPLRLESNILTAPHVEERDTQSSPSEMARAMSISLETRLGALGATVSGPPSTCRSSFDYSPEQSSAVATPVEYYSAANKDEMVLLRQQMESLLQENKNLAQKVQELKEDRDKQLQRREQEVARLTERILELEASPSKKKHSTGNHVPMEDRSMRSPSKEPMDREDDSETSSDAEDNLTKLVPY